MGCSVMVHIKIGFISRITLWSSQTLLWDNLRRFEKDSSSLEIQGRASSLEVNIQGLKIGPKPFNL